MFSARGPRSSESSGIGRRGLITGAVTGAGAAIAGTALMSGDRATDPRIALASSQPFAEDYAVVTDPAFAGGADPTGNADSAPAFRAAVQTGKPVYVPKGDYKYVGTGLSGGNLRIVGAGQGFTNIALDPGVYFVDSGAVWQSFHLSGIRFNGGAGHVRSTSSAPNVRDLQCVSDCAFINYTNTSISTNSTDFPYWKIERNIFRAVNYTTSMGIALSGLTDGSSIVDNEFLSNRVHIKLAAGGNNVYISQNDFLRYEPFSGNPRIDVWTLPAAQPVNCGSGLAITQCKFGNENLLQTDWRILYADQGAGALFGDRFPVLTASIGFISGHTVAHVLSNGIGDDKKIPLIRSTTPNISGGMYGPITQAGSDGAPILSTKTAITAPNNNIVGPLVGQYISQSPQPPLVVVVP